MITPYTPAEHAKRVASKGLPAFPREVKSPRRAMENSTRERFRLKAERSKREAAKLDAYIAERERKLAKQAVADVFDWERDGLRQRRPSEGIGW